MKLSSHLSWTNFYIGMLNTITFLSYTYTWNNSVYIYLYDSSSIDCVFYIHENYEYDTVIGVQRIDDYETHTVYDLLFNYQLIYFNYFDNWTLEGFTNFTQDNNFDALIIKLDFFEQTFIEEFYAVPYFIKVSGGINLTEYELFEII